MHQISFWDTWKLNQRCDRSTCKTGLVFSISGVSSEDEFSQKLIFLLKHVLTVFTALAVFIVDAKTVNKWQL